MKQSSKRIYQELVVSIKCIEDDLIRTSTSLGQKEVPVSWKDTWSGSWES